MKYAQLRRKALLSEYVRCLVVSGYDVISTHRQPTHAELSCEWTDQFGSTCKYLFVICERSLPSREQRINLEQIAEQHGQNMVLISKRSDYSLTSDEFFDILGGAVASWRVLGPSYAAVLLDSAYNKPIVGNNSESWKVFEETVADGLEFVFGRRVRRLGGSKRGKRVSDMLAQLPDKTVIVVDAKASKDPYDASWKNLRALVEYTKDQLKRHKGIIKLGASFIVTSSYKQDGRRLLDFGNDFISETGVPLLFVEAADIAHMVYSLSKNPGHRNRLNWRKLICRSGCFEKQRFDAELASVKVM
jgi:hypothetical protein